jgi:hypothetical protein
VCVTVEMSGGVEHKGKSIEGSKEDRYEETSASKTMLCYKQ